MQVVAELAAPSTPDQIFDEVADLARYPRWMGLVHRADPLTAVNGRPAWDVELRTRVGPLNRSKRLRMERTEMVPGRLAVFERAEVDGREHSSWVLRAEIDAPDGGLTRLQMTLTYGGSLFTGAALRAVLDHEIAEARDRLLDLLVS